MLDQDKRSAILLLHAQGHSLRKIARDVQVSRHSVSEVIRSGQAQVPVIERAHPLNPHLEAVRELYTKCRGNLVRVQEELFLRHQVRTAYSSLTRFCRGRQISEGKIKPTMRIVTEPGEEMQHDTSPYTIEVGGKSVKRQCASLVFGYCRRLYIRFYPRFDRFTCKSFLTEAFRSMGGACRRCIIDNSSVILACGAGASAQVAPEMEAFEKRFGFRFLAHALNFPDRKGKIERPFWYIERNFLAGRTFKNDADLNAQALQWLEKTANVRRMKELGASPQELFVSETPQLVPLPLYIPEVCQMHSREVDAYGYVSLHKKRYSAPPGWIGKSVLIRETDQEVVLLDGHQELARHGKLTGTEGSHQSTLPGHEHRSHHRRPDPPSSEEAQIKTLGPAAETYLAMLKGARPGWYRWAVRKLYRLFCHYRAPDVVQALRRATEYKLLDVHRVERILLQNLAQEEFLLPMGSEDYEKNPEFQKGAVTPPVDLSAFPPNPSEPLADHPSSEGDPNPPSEGPETLSPPG